MVVKVSKPEINVREKISELDKPSGVAGQAMLAAETPQEQFNLISAGRRNIIINGAMKVAQRGTSSTGVGTGGFGATDRMKVYKNNSVSYTVSQSTDAPAGFAYSHKVVSATGDSSLGAGDLASPLLYNVEGQDLQHLNYGTTDAKHSTLSFWVKTNVAGTYSVSVYKTNSSNRVYAPLYTVTTANTWQYVSLTIPPDTVAHLNSAESGLDMYFNAMAGPNYTSQSTTAWTGYNTANWAGGHTARCFASNNDSWQITGLQYEVGKVATPFEHLSFNEELALCQRYFQRLKFGGGYMRVALAYNTTVGIFSIDYSTKRAIPGIVTLPTATTSSNQVNGISLLTSGGSYRSATGSEAVAASHPSENTCRINLTSFAASGSTGDATWAYFTSTSNPSGCHIDVQAEL